MSFLNFPKAANVRRRTQATAVTALVGLSFDAAPTFAQDHAHTKTVQAINSASGLALSNVMRELWAQHMEWNYAAVTACATDSPTFDATAAGHAEPDRYRQRHQTFLGDETGDALGKLLQEQIGVAVKAAKAGDQLVTVKAIAAAYSNAQAIADFLSAANSNCRRLMCATCSRAISTPRWVYATALLQGIAKYGTVEAHR